MKLAITGATGFVGSAVLDAALSKGHRVNALARRKQGHRDRVAWVEGSLGDEKALARLCAGDDADVDAVIHIAGLTSSTDRSAFTGANVRGTANLIAAAKSARIDRFVFVSSLSAREPSLSAYGASKAEAEELVRESGLDWTIVRPPAVYGPRDRDMFEIFRAAKFGVIPMPPAGSTSIIHVEDLARLLVALAPANPITRGQVYEPWDDNPYGYTHKELGKLIAEAMGKPDATIAPLPAPLMKFGAQIDQLVRGSKAKLTADRVGYMLHEDWVCDMRKAPPLSVWQAVWGGEDGLKQTAEWYKSEGWL